MSGVPPAWSHAGDGSEMTGLLGHTTILVALGCSVFAGAARVAGARFHRPRLSDAAYRAVLVHFVLVTAAFLALEFALVTSDFSIRYVANYQTQRETMLQVGERMGIGGYELTFMGLAAAKGPTHEKVYARIAVSKGGRALGTMTPALRYYPSQQTPIAEVDYWVGLREDLYVILGSFDGRGTWVTVRAIVTPLVSWLWLGGAIMVLGTLVVIVPARSTRRRAEPALV